ncbi:MAG: hypothetical protein AMK75_02740 [Planctomycetes bacterium SM23_65]|nr:MAG: hypothetical protein AMK75_02740 [Planctomycetes bacterium SM23_65]
MVRDPKQFLLLHVEKVVLLVMILLVVLVIYVYQPWSIEVPERNDILNQLKEGQTRTGGSHWPPAGKDKDQFEVPDYVGRVNTVYRVPWPEGRAPTVRPAQDGGKFVDMPKKWRIIRDTPPTEPPVLAPTAVYAQADKGQVVVLFYIDDRSQQRKIEATGVQEYQDGLEYDHIEIWRIDKSTGEKVLITPPKWRPKDLPLKYGAPITSTGTLGLRSRSVFAEPVYFFAQERPPDAGKLEDEYRRRMEEEMRRRMADEKRREEELRRRLEDERRRREEANRRGTTPPAGKPPARIPRRTPLRTPGTTPRRRFPEVTTTPAGWHYFLDQKVDPDARYEYIIRIVCKNPVYGSPQYEQKVAELVESPPAGYLLDKPIAPFKRWYFTGGSTLEGHETGTFRVRVFVGGQREITDREISLMVAELKGDDKSKKKTTAEVTESEGTWVEHNFRIYPGEVIGRAEGKEINGEKREVDFGTGCTLVSVRSDVKVDEEPRTSTVRDKDGNIKTIVHLRRVVYPQKLRVAYVDRKGNLRTRWEETPPAMAKTGLPE